MTDELLEAILEEVRAIRRHIGAELPAKPIWLAGPKAEAEAS